MKKLLSLLLVSLLCLSLLPVGGLASGEPTDEPSGDPYSGQCGANVTWTLDPDTGVLTISGSGEMRDYSTGSPDISGGVLPPWSENSSSIQSAVIRPGVTSIGSSAFSSCYSLASVTLPDSVTSIGGSAFFACTSLTSITIPPNVTSIGDNAFLWCTNLVSAVIPNSVKSIGDYAFSCCNRLTSVNIPDGVTSIGAYTFSWCSDLASITIPDSVTEIGRWAFYDCTSLTSIIMPENVTSIGSYAFADCMGLTDVYYGGSETDWEAITIEDHNDPLLNAAITYKATGFAEAKVKLSADAKTATVTGDFTGLYARAALALFNSGNGESGLYIAPCAIEEDGSIAIPELDVPGLGVTGVSVALVRSMEDITAKAFKPVSMDYRYF